MPILLSGLKSEYAYNDIPRLPSDQDMFFHLETRPVWHMHA